MALITSITPTKKISSFDRVGPPNTPERETKKKSPSETKDGNNHTEKHPKPKPTRKKKRKEETTMLKKKGVVRKKEYKSPNDQEQKQGGLMRVL